VVLVVITSDIRLRPDCRPCDSAWKTKNKGVVREREGRSLMNIAKVMMGSGSLSLFFLSFFLSFFFPENLAVSQLAIVDISLPECLLESLLLCSSRVLDAVVLPAV